MQVIRERPCQRRHHRVTAPMNVTLPCGQTLKATDWSLGGLRLDGINAPLPKVGDLLTLELELPFQGFDISFEVEVKIARIVKETKTIGAEYTELSERANDLMTHFINDLVRGQMATIDDTICRIDIPVTPISTKPDVNPSEEVPVKRWPMKTIIMSAFYIVLGISVFSYLAVLLYSGTMKMEVKSAVISQPLLTLKMPTDGVLVPVNLKLNQSINKGDEIAYIVSSQLENKITSKQRQYEEKARMYKIASEKYRIESERMKLYQVITRTDRQIAQARVASSREALQAADAAFERIVELKAKGLISQNKYDEVQRRRANAQYLLEENEYTLERATLMNSVSSRRFFNQEEFVADLDLRALEVEEINSQLQTIGGELEHLIKAKSQLSLKAPFTGRIVSIKELGNTKVTKNADILTMEKTEKPTVTAFLSQEQILSVGLNDEANIYLPATGSQAQARVIKIDRNAAFLETDKSHYVWSDKELVAAVSLEINSKDYDSQSIIAGMPAIVMFSKRSTSDLYKTISNKLSSITEGLFDGSQI